METIQKSFKQAMKKGYIGEEIVREYLESQQYQCFSPETEGAHPFDKLAVNVLKNKVIALDVKTKTSRNKYKDTGIDERHFQLYKNISEQHNMEFFVIFVDEISRTVYGNKLTELEKPKTIGNKLYPSIEPCKNGVQIRYWSLESMKFICKISDEDAERMKELSQRNYDYLEV